MPDYVIETIKEIVFLVEDLLVQFHSFMNITAYSAVSQRLLHLFFKPTVGFKIHHLLIPSCSVTSLLTIRLFSTVAGFFKNISINLRVSRTILSERYLT
jgi:hypothetical protein